MKSRLFVPFFALAGLILLVGLACGTVTTPTAQPPVQVQPTQPPPVQIQPTEPPPTEAPVETSAYFTEEFDSEPANWEISLTNGDPEKYTTEFSGSRMIFDLEDLDINVYYIFQSQSYSDVRLDINAENRGKNNNNVSLVCRKSDEGWYEFSTEGGGLWYLYAATPTQDRKINYNVIDNGGALSLKQGKEVNEYTMICKGNDITLMINGVEVKKVKEKKYAFRDGYVGFNISSLNVTPIIVEVDWFKVSEP